MAPRTAPDALAQAAEDALRIALDQVGLGSVAAGPEGKSADLVLTLPGGDRRLVEVKTAAVPTTGWILQLSAPGDGGSLVVVGDQISAEARQFLNERNIGWLDRRGHLRLAADGLFVDSDIRPIPRAGSPLSATRRPINGRAGLAAAAALLMQPDNPLSASATARAAHLNPSSITRALHALVRAQLAERRPGGTYRPLVPELFWALADVWPRERTSVPISLDQLPDARFGANVQDLEVVGWSLGGERGAVTWGAPLVLTGDYPSFFYVPDDRDLRRLTALADPANPPETTVQVAVDPVGLVTKPRFRLKDDQLPLAHPLFCALDLTATSRDREALEQWTPPQGFVRVW